MRNKFLIFVLLWLSIPSPSAQGVPAELGLTQNLALYIKSWGLVRFHMPSNELECRKLDSICLSGIKKILQKPNRRSTNSQIKLLLKSFPEIENPTNQKMGIRYPFQNMTNLGNWTESSLLHKRNATRLSKINVLSKGELVYNLTAPSGTKAREIDYCYENSDYEVAHRLFALGYLWNCIQNFYPYLDELPTNWQFVLNEFITKTICSDSKLAFHLVLSELIGLINDGHATINSFELMNYWGFFSLPFELDCFDFNDSPVVTKISKTRIGDSNIQLGDRIVEIGGVSFIDFCIKSDKYISANNKVVKINKLLSKYCQRSTNDSVEIIFERDEHLHKVFILPQPWSQANTQESSSIYLEKAIDFFGDSICYLNLSKIEPKDFNSFFNKTKGKKFTIIDLRSYPTNILDTIARYYFDSPRIISKWQTQNEHLNDSLEDPRSEIIGKSGNPTYHGTLVLLVNNRTISRGEYIAMALQSIPSTKTIGIPTTGTNGDVLKFNLPYDLRGMFTSIKVMYPNCDQMNITGLRIDYLLDPHETLSTKYDAYIIFALEQITKGGL